MNRLLEVYEVVGQIALVFWVLFYVDSTIEDLFSCALALSKTCLFFCQHFPSLGLESVDHNSEHDLAGMADLADVAIVLTLLERRVASYDLNPKYDLSPKLYFSKYCLLCTNPCVI